LSVNRWYAGVYGHYRLFRNTKNHQLVVKGNVNYESSFNNLLSLDSESTIAPVTGDGTFKRGTYDIATNVLIPDFEYYNAGVLKLAFTATYSFPLQLKSTRLIAFTKAYVQTHQTTIDNSRSAAGISFGIYP
jgi:alpha-galactosidase